MTSVIRTPQKTSFYSLSFFFKFYIWCWKFSFHIFLSSKIISKNLNLIPLENQVKKSYHAKPKSLPRDHFYPNASLSSAITYYLKQYSCIFGHWLVLSIELLFLVLKLNWISHPRISRQASFLSFFWSIISLVCLSNPFSASWSWLAWVSLQINALGPRGDSSEDAKTDNIKEKSTRGGRPAYSHRKSISIQTYNNTDFTSY